MAAEEEDFDLFHRLYSDPIHLILSFSTFTDLCIQSTVSSEWYAHITPNNPLWTALAKSYWNDKYVPRQYKLLLRTSINEKNKNMSSECTARRAFRLAYMDRTRTTMTMDELVSFKWYFRFKDEAGENFKMIDPFWNLDNESDADSDSNSDHFINYDDMQNDDDLKMSKPQKPTGILTDDDMNEYELKHTEYQKNKMSENGNMKLTEYEQRLLRCTRIEFGRDGSMKYTKNRILRNVLNTDDFVWRFCGSFYENGMFGDYVQYHSYPKKKVSRHPNNWGFIMQSNWVIFTSFDMPNLHSDDDALINEKCFRLQDFFEFDFGGNDNGMMESMKGKKVRRILMGKNGMIDLEKLKEMRVECMKKKEVVEPSGDTLDLQYIISRIMGRYGQ